MEARIASALDEIEASGARIILAVESGSRAWGFPSPDSDWDVRFIYAMPPSHYLQIRDRRDVIECQDGLMDLSGWDVRKAIGLLLKSNASAVEWLRSPVVYRQGAGLDALRDFASAVSIGGLRRHYYYLARSIWRERFASRGAVPIKKYFYLIRPCIALRHIRVNDGPVPMDLPALLAGADMPDVEAEIIGELVARKAISREMDDDDRIDALDEFCLAEMALAEAALGKEPHPTEARYNEADDLFRRLIGFPDPPTDEFITLPRMEME